MKVRAGGMSILLAAGLAALAAYAQPAVLDDFEDLSGWSVEATEGVKARLVSAPGRAGHAMCLAFDFGKVSGYALARRRLALDFPANFELGFDVRGDARTNALHVRFADESGDNVWWRPMPGFTPPREWERLKVKRRHIAFAWGPAKDHALSHTATVEFAIAREKGGAGRVCFDRLTLRELPATPPPPLAPIETRWRSPGRGEQSYTIDLGAVREFGGLVLRWAPGAQATRFDVDLSEDGASWRMARRVVAGGAQPHALRLPESEARFVRLRLHAGAGAAYALDRVEVRPLAFGESPNAFFMALAREAPRGHYPRGFSGEQAYWTVLGIDGGSVQALMSEDGAIEPRPGAPALEPMVVSEGRLLTWADAKIVQGLVQGDLPMPNVQWQRDDLALAIDAFAMGTPARSQVMVRYTLGNRADVAREATLVLAARPFQVNPPTQFLNTTGGVATVKAAGWDGTALAIDGVRRAWPSRAPDAAWAAPFDGGNLADWIVSPAGLGARGDDATGLASAALTFRMALAPRESRALVVVLPLTGEPRLPTGDASAWFAARQREVAAAWREKLDRVRLRVPPAAQPIADTLRTAIAHVLISRNGPALQPGTRSYARSWIRDGAMMGEALLRTGHADVVRAFADWFSTRLFPSGKVPCCADARGADPVPENDSHGEWVRLVSQYYRYTHDTAWLRRQWPGVVRAVGYMEKLRAESRRESDAEAYGYAGLLMPSISHEGYSDKPAWSYWDDFWALAAYRAAPALARAVGDDEQARRLTAARDDFTHDLSASIAKSRARHGIAFIPGSADRGDFDATSTTIALSEADALGLVPRAWFDATFERYWQEFIARRDGTKPWEDYTPYEWRNVGALVRLGEVDRAHAAIDFFMADRRPAAWNQWAEVVGREARKPRFVGDMPHAWVASDYVHAALDLFACEREAEQSIVLAAGIPEAWIAAGEVSIAGLRTPWGEVGYGIRQEGNERVLEVPAGIAVPPGGFIVPARLTGSEEARILRVPARIVLRSRP